MTKLLVVTTIPLTLKAFLLPYAHHFRAQGWQVHGMASGISADARCREAFDAVHEIDWSRNPIDPRNFFGRPEAIRALIDREGYDLVHVHTPVAAFVTRFALRGRRLPKVVYTAHGFHFHEGGSGVKNAVFLTLEKLAARWTDHLIVINKDDEAAALRHGLLTPERIHYMPGIGVDTEALAPETVSPTAVAAVRRDLGLGDTDQLLLMVAELSSRKRNHDAIDALARVKRPGVHLALAGTGPQEQALRALAAERGVAERVHFLGWRGDVPALVRASMGTLLTSEQEGLPRCALESLSLGVPVIGTDIRGTRELLADGCGLLVPVGDVGRLAEAMVRMLDRPGETAAMGRLGRERIADYDVRRVIAMHEAVYRQALGASADLAVTGA